MLIPSTPQVVGPFVTEGCTGTATASLPASEFPGSTPAR